MSRRLAHEEGGSIGLVRIIDTTNAVGERMSGGWVARGQCFSCGSYVTRPIICVVGDVEKPLTAIGAHRLNAGLVRNSFPRLLRLPHNHQKHV